MDALKLPESVRQDMEDLQLAINSNQQALNAVGRTAFLFLGLDPTLPHHIDPVTGIVTPFAPGQAPKLPALHRTDCGRLRLGVRRSPCDGMVDDGHVGDVIS